MGLSIQVQNLSFAIRKEKTILNKISVGIPAGAFVAVLGENGAGKTTLLDLMMGFKKPTSGSLFVDGQEPHLDPWEQRHSVAYLSEKIDLPGDASVGEYLAFNRFFYRDYSTKRERKLIKEFRVDPKARIGNLSAGEVRRVQIVAALSAAPKLIIIDEITAVLDIVGRQKLLEILQELNETDRCTIILATNILEDLAEYASHVCLISQGRMKTMEPITKFLGAKRKKNFSKQVVKKLEVA